MITLSRLNPFPKHASKDCRGSGWSIHANQIEAAKQMLRLDSNGYMALAPDKRNDGYWVHYYSADCDYCGTAAGSILEARKLRRK